MPIMKSPQQFPGTENLPQPLQVLLKEAFPPNNLGIGMGGSMGGGMVMGGAAPKFSLEALKKPLTAMPEPNVLDNLNSFVPWRGLKAIGQKFGL